MEPSCSSTCHLSTALQNQQILRRYQGVSLSTLVEESRRSLRIRRVDSLLSVRWVYCRGGRYLERYYRSASWSRTPGRQETKLYHTVSRFRHFVHSARLIRLQMTGNKLVILSKGLLEVFSVNKGGKVKMSASLEFKAFDSPISSFCLVSSTTVSSTLIAITADHFVHVWTISALNDSIESISRGPLDDSTSPIASLSPLSTSADRLAARSGTSAADIRLVAIDEIGRIAFRTLEDTAKVLGNSTTTQTSLENGDGASHRWKEGASVKTGRTGVKLLQSNAEFVTAIGE